jgi:thiamine-phosphate pyrophosphorylase
MGDRMPDLRQYRICFITGVPDPACTPEFVVAALLESGIRFIQYRAKDKTRKELYAEALKLRALTKRFDACFIINDYVDIALAVDADGVHLGQDDLPLEEARKIMGTRIIGISTHTLREAVEAEQGGADYIGFGAIFPTTTKEVGMIQGADALRAIRHAVHIPIFAIGGITADNARSVFATGCDGVAVSSGLLRGDVKENARRLLACSLA